MAYWSGEYTDELKADGWIENGEGPPYKEVREPNGYWEIIRFYGDIAIYSSCPFCGYSHHCDKMPSKFVVEYAPEKEFNFCPMCGTQMLVLENK